MAKSKVAAHEIANEVRTLWAEIRGIPANQVILCESCGLCQGTEEEMKEVREGETPPLCPHIIARGNTIPLRRCDHYQVMPGRDPRREEVLPLLVEEEQRRQIKIVA
jgi:hypothetical protein